MAIEPLGSMMSVQAQSQVQTKPAAQSAKTAAEYTDVSARGTAVPVDKAISIVENSQNKGNSNNAGEGENGKQPTNEQIKKAVESLNKKMEHSEAVFGIHEETNRVTIKIVNKDTKEVIKELPPEKTLDMIAKVWEMAGILVDEKR
ncbi:MAG: flagellar protein FlaG [Lachnospiraceae bacterium]|nr:flagellar protein FlaG [Lachnospiraceae bacterium]